jgi:hypothetical protein
MRGLITFLVASSLVALASALRPQVSQLQLVQFSGQRNPSSPLMISPLLPALPTITKVCTMPTCIAFWRSEYGVTYAYGASLATMGGLVFRAAPTRLARWHAAALLVYGVRLNAFLMWRELNVPRFRGNWQRTEERAGGRLKRLPFVLSCSALCAFPRPVHDISRSRA